MTPNAGAGLGPAFARLWAATTLSALGSGLATVAAPLFVASRTDDPLVVAGASAVAWLPWLLFALPGGVLVDRMDRRRLMIVIDLVRVVALAVLATAILTGHGGVALLYAVLFLVNTGEIVFRAASQAIVPSVVPRHRLERANGWLSGGATLMHSMLAGPLGGFLFALSAGSPFLVNAVTYALSAVLVALIGGDFRAAAGDTHERRTRSMGGEIVEGLRWLANQRLLRTMAVLIGLLNVTLTAALAVLVLLAGERLGLGSVGYGLLFTCMATGGVLGALLGDRIIARSAPPGRSGSACSSRRGCTWRWPRPAAPSWSGSRCSPSACTAGCGTSWPTPCANDSPHRRCRAGWPARPSSWLRVATAWAHCWAGCSPPGSASPRRTGSGWW